VLRKENMSTDALSVELCLVFIQNYLNSSSNFIYRETGGYKILCESFIFITKLFVNYAQSERIM
jgi:hypothetical protein